jgi:Mor family transcriptional regulator
VLTRQEREQNVLDLYNQGKTIREIAKEIRMSFRDIGAVLKKRRRRKDKRDNWNAIPLLQIAIII